MKRLELLREQMRKEKIDFYIVPTGDPHGSEYPAKRYKDREWLTGFTGSAGTALATLEEGYVWIDGRYYIQGKRQLKGSGFEMKKAGLPDTESLEDALIRLGKSGSVIGYNGKLLMASGLENIKSKLRGKKVEFKDRDLISPLWDDRPSLPDEELFILEQKYTKYTAKEKIEQIRERLSEKEADGTVISALDDIAWTCNLRGRDIPENPVFYAFMIVTDDNAVLYLPKDRQTDKILKYLDGQGISVKNYEEIYADVENLTDKNIYVDPQKTSSRLKAALEKGNMLIEGINLTTKLKAIKNDVEIANEKEAYRTDALALVKYFSWLQREGKYKGVTEYEAQKKLTDFRKESELYIEDSFTPISAYGPNGAMMHYSADPETSAELKPEGFYLIDSGGQYYTGTTDITRTLALGELNETERRDYTLTLKSHIALATTVFLEKTTGNELDAIARRPMWQYHLDYKCGTGHGVGYLLNVHEGPHNISRNKIDVPMEPGMAVTIEPGVYKEDKYGIRLENVYVVAEDGEAPDGKFFSFELLSYIPFDIHAVEPSLLTAEEKKWLNDYHKKTYELLKDDLNETDRKWLQEATKAIGD